MSARSTGTNSFGRARAPDRKPVARTGGRGIALIAVLWLVLLLSVIAGSLLMLTRTELGLSRNLVLSAQARALAEGGVHIAAQAMLDTDPAARWIADGRSYGVQVETGNIEIAVQDVSGLIDLNAAAPELLAGLFQAVGVAEDEAVVLADRLADWRDPDDDRRPNGAEAGDYDTDGLEIRVGNALFLTPDEIQRVPGITTALWNRVAPVVTIYSRRPGINPSTAPRLAMIAIPGIDETIADEIIVAREETVNDPTLGPSVGAVNLASLIPASARRYTTGGKTNVFVIRSRATLTGGGEYAQQAVIELALRSTPPWRIHAWRPGETSRQDASGPSP